LGTPFALLTIMEAGIGISALALLAALFGSVWIRRAEVDSAGDSGALMLGLVFAFVAVVLILIAVAGELGT